MPGQMVSLLALKSLKASRVTRRCRLSYPTIGLASAVWQWPRFSFPSSHLFWQRLRTNFPQHDKRLPRLLVKLLIVKTIKHKKHLSSNSSHSAINPRKRRLWRSILNSIHRMWVIRCDEWEWHEQCMGDRISADRTLRKLKILDVDWFQDQASDWTKDEKRRYVSVKFFTDAEDAVCSCVVWNYYDWCRRVFLKGTDELHSKKNLDWTWSLNVYCLFLSAFRLFAFIWFNFFGF